MRRGQQGQGLGARTARTALGLLTCLGLAGGLVHAGVARAATDTISTCTAAALRSAISSAVAGDTLRFTCSGTIDLTSDGGGTLSISKNLTLDATGQTVNLSGANSVQVVSVPRGVTAAL
ncbi:MAG TPA: hypothetical protein VHB98_04275, partial [Chloroflexota bacterium]|nr:hypothetical protein [Chloroflexota bacterium]